MTPAERHAVVESRRQPFVNRRVGRPQAEVLPESAEAHRVLEAGGHSGKVLLTMGA